MPPPPISIDRTPPYDYTPPPSSSSRPHTPTTTTYPPHLTSPRSASEIGTQGHTSSRQSSLSAPINIIHSTTHAYRSRTPSPSRRSREATGGATGSPSSFGTRSSPIRGRVAGAGGGGGGGHRYGNSEASEQDWTDVGTSLLSSPILHSNPPSGGPTKRVFGRRKALVSLLFLSLFGLICVLVNGRGMVDRQKDQLNSWVGLDKWKLQAAEEKVSTTAAETEEETTVRPPDAGPTVGVEEEEEEVEEQIVEEEDEEQEFVEEVVGQEKAEAKGGNGSTIITEDGEEFVYVNQFGGTWDSTPFSNTARAQEGVPTLGEEWDYSRMSISGVNLGGWLTLEPFITPSLFEPYLNTDHPAIDEWTLCENLGDEMETVLTEHYSTFITERDFAEIAGAGLTWVRIPLSWWAIEMGPGEPFLANVSWRYFLKAMIWARKYGLRINLDLHAVPGSQNGWNHSGKFGTVGFLNGVMGIVNAERTLNLIRTLAEFISLPGNSEVIPMFSVLNEPFLHVIGIEAITSFYHEAYNTVRNASGLGLGNGPFITFHDGFKGTRIWYGYLEGADRIALDSHRYLCFRFPNTDPLPVQALKPCNNWQTDFNRTMSRFGLALVGEWSLATNDCGRFLNGVQYGTRFEGTFPTAEEPDQPGVAPLGSCEKWEDVEQWDDQMKSDLRDIAYAQMDAFQNWFYWTWKTGPSLLTSKPANPMWSYSSGLQHNYIPSDPRRSKGFCNSNAIANGFEPIKPFKFVPPLKDWQIGGEGAGELLRMKEGKFPWPPVKFADGNLTSELPQWVKEGKEGVRLEGPRPEGEEEEERVPRGEGGWWKEVEGCTYLDPWEGVDVEEPEPLCPGLMR